MPNRFWSPQFFQCYRPINDIWQTISVFGSIIMGKEPLEELKFSIFKNWLDTRPKMETHEPNVYPTILAGVSRGFWSPFLDLSPRSAIFWHLKTGTFGKSARFRVPKNGTLSAQIFERTPKTLRNTSPNGGVDSWFMRFHFRASIKPIFKNCSF